MFFTDHPHPGEHEQAAADLLNVTEDWRTGAAPLVLLTEKASDYAAGIPDWYRDVPELYATADRLTTAAAGDNGYEVVERVRELLDAETAWLEGRSADAFSAMHGRDPWAATV